MRSQNRKVPQNSVDSAGSDELVKMRRNGSTTGAKKAIEKGHQRIGNRRPKLISAIAEHIFLEATMSSEEVYVTRRPVELAASSSRVVKENDMVQQVRLIAEQIAEEAKPAWKVAPAPYKGDVDEPRVVPDAALPEISTLLNKYFGTPETETSTDAASDSGDDTALISMEPKEAQNIRAGRKSVYVRKSKVVGEQG